MPVIFGRVIGGSGICAVAAAVKATRKAAARKLECILHLESSGIPTLNRFCGVCKDEDCEG
ncbi:MAG: hypothetical protein ACLQGT_03490 [Terracidiphilus sp.]